MNVWVLELFSYGEVSVWSEDTNILNIPQVKAELDALDGEYLSEKEDFIQSFWAGQTSLMIEERFEINFVEVEEA